MGRYANVVNPFPAQVPASEGNTAPPRIRRVLDRFNIRLADGDRWVKPSDFTGSQAVIGRARARFGAAVAAFDANGDGRLDLFLASAIAGPDGIRDALLVNQGEGRFEDATAAFGLPKNRASLGVAAADFDADRHIDLFLTGVGGNRLYRNRDGKRYEDISSALAPIGPPAVSLTARWLDLDQDGDLDLYVVNYCPAEQAQKAFVESTGPPAGKANSVYRNDGQPEPIPSSPAPAWAPLAVAWNNIRAKAGLSVALDSLDDREGTCRPSGCPYRNRRARHRWRPRSGPGLDRGGRSSRGDPQRSARAVPRICNHGSLVANSSFGRARYRLRFRRQAGSRRAQCA